MSVKYAVIDRKCLPQRAPLTLTLVAWLMLDRIQPAGWVVGMVWTFLGICWILASVIIWEQTSKPLEGFGKDA